LSLQDLREPDGTFRRFQTLQDFADQKPAALWMIRCSANFQLARLVPDVVMLSDHSLFGQPVSV
jgi:hypothetical protein